MSYLCVIMEYITSENIILTGATLLIAGIIIGKMSYRFGLPLLLVFMLVGMLFGTDGLGLQFNDMEAAQGVGMVSLLVQGTTVLTAARRLHLVDDDAAGEEFEGVEIADELPTSLETITVDAELLKNGDTLSAISLPSGSLVMMIRRGDHYIVPDGKRRLHPGDHLLLIREESRK